MTHRKPGPIPQPQLRRSVRVSVSLPADVGEMLAYEPGYRAQSRTVEDALTLWYAMPERERQARLTAVWFTRRSTAQ